MVHENDQFDEKMDLKVAESFSTDLKAVFKPSVPVPPEVDRAVIDRVQRHFVRRWPKQAVRWAGTAAAVAAAVIIVFVLQSPRKPALKTMGFEKAARRMAADRLVGPSPDIDGSGRVDILDAFRLARHIKSTERLEGRWDFNGDGLVNREDVDVVAFAAVRLHKGVM
jgi:hypothetical protein